MTKEELVEVIRKHTMTTGWRFKKHELQREELRVLLKHWFEKEEEFECR